jgi:Fe-Mn family superoxide dismutase
MTHQHRSFTIPEIPGISREQLMIHLGLYEGYVKHVNLLESELRALDQAPEHAYVVGELRKRRGFEWNGMRLHELYFEQIEGAPSTLTADTNLFAALTKQFGGFTEWHEMFRTLTARGPGWALLTYDTVNSTFENIWVEDHQVGQLAGTPIVLALDHWEHAYMVDYRPADKMKYIDAYLAAVNWKTVATRFESLSA